MSEVICPLCSQQSPEQAMYCQYCGQPLRCKECRTELLPTARACIQCGKLIPERSKSESFHVGIGSVPPGYNRLKLHETTETRDVDLTVSNEAIVHIGDLLPSLVGIHSKRFSDNSTDQQSQQQSGLVEITPEEPIPHTQLPVTLLQPVLPEQSSSKGAIWDIFRKQEGGGLKQDIQKLKAATKKDYTIRLVYLYLYAKLQLGEETVSRSDVYTILYSAGLKDGNTANNINQATGISPDENETLRLNYEGRKQVQQYITDVFNEELTDGWYPGSDNHPTGNHPKKPSKKGSEPRSNPAADVARWVSHEATRTLVDAIPHTVIASLPVLDKSLFALYGIYKTGSERSVPVVSIAQYLRDAFSVQMESQAISSAFYRAKKAKAQLVISSGGHGYRITPSGCEHIEEVLKLK